MAWVAMFVLAGCIIGGWHIPGWLYSITLIIWITLIASPRSADANGDVLAKSVSVIAIAGLSLYLALFVTFVVIAHEEIELKGIHLVFFILFNTTHTEVLYAWRLRKEIGMKWMYVPACLGAFYSWASFAMGT